MIVDSTKMSLQNVKSNVAENMALYSMLVIGNFKTNIKFVAISAISRDTLLKTMVLRTRSVNDFICLVYFVYSSDESYSF